MCIRVCVWGCVLVYVHVWLSVNGYIKSSTTTLLSNSHLCVCVSIDCSMHVCVCVCIYMYACVCGGVCVSISTHVVVCCHIKSSTMT